MTYSFPAHIFKDENSFGVEFPDVPGCYTYGETLEDALRYAAEALSGHLEVLIEFGGGIPIPSDTVTLQQPGDIYALITCEIDDAVARQAG